MKLVNLDGLTIIGPGSEWFWAAAQFIVVVVSLYGIYRQLRSQGAANAVQRIETLEGEWNSTRLSHARLAVALHLKYETDDMAGFFKARPVLDFFVNLGNLYEWGYLSIEEVEATWGDAVPIWAALTRRLVDAERTAAGRPDLYDFEPLIMSLRAHRLKRGGKPARLDAAATGQMLDFAIAANTAALEHEASWQARIIPRAPTPSDVRAGDD